MHIRLPLLEANRAILGPVSERFPQASVYAAPKWYPCVVSVGGGFFVFVLTRKLFSLRDAARKVSQKQHEEALERFNVYKQWLLNHVLRVHERDPILIWEIAPVWPRYRDEWPTYALSP